MAARRATLGFAIAAMLASGSIPSQAQDWPSRAVKVIVPYGPGGITDVIARLVADRLSKALGQAFVIENRGGAGGVIGTEVAARSPADGYTVYIAGGAPLTIVPQMQKLSFDPTRDLAPVGMITINGMAFTVRPDLPVHSLREFIDYVKAHPGEINYSVGGIGTSSHLAPTLLAAREGLHMVAVPYQSMPPTIQALLTKTVDMFFGNISDVIDPIRNGGVRLLAISTAERSPQFPDVPTVAETVPGFTMTGWHGLFAPAGTPRPIIERMSAVLAAISHEPEFNKILSNLGIDTISSTPDGLAQAIKADTALFRAALDAAGLLRKEAAN
jgi:tripartite-type tricarboxylate transporter receptor subunit TctC